MIDRSGTAALHRLELWDQCMELLIAVYRQAIEDARKGDTDALEFIQDTVPALDREGLLAIRRRQPRRRVPRYISMN